MAQKASLPDHSPQQKALTNHWLVNLTNLSLCHPAPKEKKKKDEFNDSITDIPLN